MKKIFISYHHKREQSLKNELSDLIKAYGDSYQLKDMSVDTGDIDSNIPTQTIYNIIREKYLLDTDVTIVILGLHTKCRKHIDREIGSSLRSYGINNTKNGLLILLTDDFIQKYKKNDIFLNTFSNSTYNNLITQENSGQRIYDNVKSGYAIVAKFNEATNIYKLSTLINMAYNNSKKLNPDNNAPFRTNNSEDCPGKLLW